MTFGVIEDGYREYIELIRTWFSEGLISQEFTSRNQNRNGSEATAARYGDYCGIFGVDPTVMDTIEAEHTSPGFEMTPITYPVKSEGDTIHLAERSETVYPYLALTTACEDTESAAVFLDWWFSDEGVLLRNYGVEGLTYNLSEGGEPVYTELYTENDGSLVSSAEFSQYYFFPIISGFELANTLDPSEHSEKSVNATGVWYSNMDDAWYLPSLSLSGEAGEAFSAKFGDITTCCAENVFKFIYGERPMDEWDDFLSTLDDLGIYDCIAAWQSAYDAYVSRLG